MARRYGFSVTDQTEELCAIIGRLAAMSGALREGYMRGKSLPGDDLVQQSQALIEEIAFVSVKEEVEMFGEPLENRRPALRYQGMLSHLQLMTATMVNLAQELQKRLGDGVSLSGSALERCDVLLTHQEMILCTLEEAIRTGDAAHLRAVCQACSELTSLGARCAAEQGKELASVEELLRSLVQHEREIAKLLVRWREAIPLRWQRRSASAPDPHSR